MKITPFGMRNPALCPTAPTQLNVQTVENDIIRIARHTGIEFRSHVDTIMVGPMIAGSGDVVKLRQNNLSSQNLVCIAKANINSELENFWRLESMKIQESPNDNDDEETLKCFQRTLKKKDGRHHVCWPWRDSKQNLSNNYGLCLGRLKNLIGKLQLRSLFQVHHNTIMEQLQTDRIEEVPHNDEVGVIPYLPHHEVWISV
ncbi:unnamed protein product [Onchocerca ochengi]|uniref:TGT domain-containing protein n=1 Tax=Onchocerca ochengi TaxID=42157 RepID=A0A182ES90_ONCOC|nr:unnamed protein product [Onchocerca ochengi]